MSQKVLSKQEASDFFDALDADGSGQCSFREIKQGLKKHFVEFYGQACDDYFMKCFQNWDKDDDHMVSREEFVDDLTKKPRQQAITEAFGEMDKDGSGKVNLDEFRRVMNAAGIDCEKTITENFAEVDCDGDGNISIEELRRQMNQSQCR